MVNFHHNNIELLIIIMYIHVWGMTTKNLVGHFGPREVFVDQKLKNPVGHFGPSKLFVDQKLKNPVGHFGPSKLFVDQKLKNPVGHFGPREKNVLYPKLNINQ